MTIVPLHQTVSQPQAARPAPSGADRAGEPEPTRPVHRHGAGQTGRRLDITA